MGFGINNKELTVLESRFQIYENLSKQMLDKLERVIDRIIESNNTVAIILERHENRLDQNSRSNVLMTKMVEEVKEAIDKRTTIIEKRIEDISRIKWAIICASLVFGIVAVLPYTTAFGRWDPNEPGYKIQRKGVPAGRSK